MNNPYQVHDPFIREADDWRLRSKCRGTDEPDAWFPHYAEERNIDTKAVLALCASCPVRWECHQAAINSGRDEHGIWGGYTESQRREHQRGRTAS
jgi:WhiB family redox-sensing transcriptional regulator